MTSADRKLKKLFAGWRSLCPPDVGDIQDVNKATAATDKLERELSSVQTKMRRNPDGYEEVTADDVSEMQTTLKSYRKELRDLEKRLGELKRWLARVRTSSDPLPFALVAKGNSKGSLHVFKQETRVERDARSGKQEISGAKIYDGECRYEGGKLVFKFTDGPRAPWKMLLQGMVNQANVNMKVALEGLGDDDQATA